MTAIGESGRSCNVYKLKQVNSGECYDRLPCARASDCAGKVGRGRFGKNSFLNLAQNRVNICV